MVISDFIKVLFFIIEVGIRVNCLYCIKCGYNWCFWYMFYYIKVEVIVIKIMG